MKILSWDVGIINLSYCILNCNEETWNIEDWGNINLTNRDSLKCITCNKNASYYTDISNINYYCKKHLPVVSCRNYDELFKTNNDNNLQCCWNSKMPCSKKAKMNYIIKNYNFCTTHSKSIYKKIENTYKIKKIPKKAVKSIPIDELNYDLIKTLESYKQFLDVDIVIIENQPTLKNPKMKAISSALYNYFLIRGIFDKKINKSTITSIKFISPSNKLKIASDGDTQRLIKLKGEEAKTYKLTKALSIKYCKEFLKNFTNWSTFFENQKKKDDLADSFLQGIYYYNEKFKN